MRQDSRVVAAVPPHPPALVVVAPAEREVSFGRIAGRVPRGRWAVVVRAAGRTIAVREIRGASFDFAVSLPRRETTVRVAIAGAHGRRASAAVPHVVGLPRSAWPRPVDAQADGGLGVTLRALARAFPGTSAVYVRDLVSGRGAAWNARARFPAASTLKVAIALAVLRAQASKPAPGSPVDALLRRMLLVSENGAANDLEAIVGGPRRVDELLRGLGLVDTWMGGAYLRETAGRTPIPMRVESQPSFGCCKYTSAFDLARLLGYIHLAAGGRGPLAARYGREVTASDARYLLYLLAHVPDREKLGRFLAGGPYALLHKAGWISTARHDAGLVYWPGGAFVAAVMTWGSGVGAASDVLAGKVANATLKRLQRIG
jgi:beta-lactamase class A